MYRTATNRQETHWIVRRKDKTHYHYICGNCGTETKYRKSLFCSNCGFQMSGGEIRDYD